MRKGLIIAAVMLLIVVLRDTVVLGKFITVLSMPCMIQRANINIGDVLTRVEIIYAIVLVALLFFQGQRRLLCRRVRAQAAVRDAILPAVRQYSRRAHLPLRGGQLPTNSEHVKWRMTTAARFRPFSSWCCRS